jgi:two-component sensor histidine kinase
VSASALEEVYEAPFWRLLGVGTIFLAVFLTAAVAMASMLGRRIVTALGALSHKADALRRGEVVEVRPTLIAEFNAVMRILRNTAEELQLREQQRSLLIDELNHRVEDTLATVQALARRTFISAAPEVYRTFEKRLMALSATHTLLTTTNWSGANLRDVLSRELSPYGDRVELAGEDIVIPAKVVLGLSTIMHELATNAAKHGALSVPHGRVDLSWILEDDTLALSWRESGGPPVPTPVRNGFGTTLMKMTAERELAGDFRILFEPAGLRYELSVPLGRNVSAYRGISQAA